MARKKNIYEPKETYTNIYGQEESSAFPTLKCNLGILDH